jgi:CheY-like chemotaxis protein
MLAHGERANLNLAGEPVACGPEFLVVCADMSTFKTFMAAIRAVKGRLNCSPTASCAHDYLLHRRVDGIIVDMNVPGAAELIQYLRTMNPRRAPVIFACMGDTPASARASAVGANFVFYRPLLSAKVAQVLTIAAPVMAGNTRRYYRRPVMVPITLQMGGREVRSITKNLSEGGIGLWSLPYHLPGSELEFMLDIPSAGGFHGTGEIVWNKEQNLAGIKFHILPNETYTRLSAWINSGVLGRAA